MRKSMHEMEYSFTLPGLRRRSPWHISIVPVGNQIDAPMFVKASFELAEKVFWGLDC
jgi:hypothetical protein